ncbi:MAG: aminoglycoside phosphotransferase family protein [Acidimicrobiia bacterium]|nr:aminoglycoside phosphotransferase family protein [Acidimicrobiia bacterium]
MSIPTTLDRVTPEWLSSVLDTEVGSVRVDRIGADRGFTSECGLVAADGLDLEFVVKLPRPDHWERSLREIRLLETVNLPVRAPRVLSSDFAASDRRTAILMSRACGEPGDVVAGTTADRLASLISDLADLHAGFRSPTALEKLEWLPRWGAGTTGAEHPHIRRVERYASRIGPFLANHGRTAPAWSMGLLETAAIDLEERLGRLADLPPTLIHGDAHLDNIVFKKDTATWLDWQSASRGPGLYDVVRLLGETIDITDDLAQARRLVQRWANGLRSAGVPEDEIEREIDHLPDMAVAVLVGFVSGYGTRTDLAERERRMVARAVSPEGLFGFVRHLAA